MSVSGAAGRIKMCTSGGDLAYNHSTHKVEAGGFQVKGSPELQYDCLRKSRVGMVTQ